MWVLAAVLGVLVGSFLNVCIDRLPQRRSILGPRSCCSACGRAIATRDLIPIVSFVLLRGRCRWCAASIPRRLPLVEGFTGVLFVALAARFGLTADFAFGTFVASVFLVVFVIDLEQRLIPNRVIYPAGLVAAALLPLPVGPAPLQAAAGALTGLAVLGIIIAVYPEGMGLGDAKLAAFVGLVAGFPGILVALFLAFVGGGVVSALALATRRCGRKDALPFAPFLTVAGMVAITYGEVVLEWHSTLVVI